MKKTKTKVRESGIELLRIIAMLMIVAHHFAIHTPWNVSAWSSYPFTWFWKEILASFGKIGVGIFFAITGYFLSSKKVTFQKIRKIISPVWFYAILFLFLFLATEKIDLQSEPSLLIPTVISSAIFPFSLSYWFMGSYIVLILLSPCLKKAFDAIGAKDLTKILIILPIVNWLVVMFGAISSNRTNSLFAYSTPIYYLALGYAIRNHENSKKIRKISYISLLIGISALVLAPILHKYLLQRGYTFGSDIFWNEASLLSVLVVFSLVAIFRNFKFKNKVINYIASLTLGAYLVHDNRIVRSWLWDTVLNNSSFAAEAGGFTFIPYSLRTILSVFCISLFIEAFRKVLFLYMHNKSLKFNNKLEVVINKEKINCLIIFTRIINYDKS